MKGFNYYYFTQSSGKRKGKSIGTIGIYRMVRNQLKGWYSSKQGALMSVLYLSICNALNPKLVLALYYYTTPL